MYRLLWAKLGDNMDMVRHYSVRAEINGKQRRKHAKAVFNPLAAVFVAFAGCMVDTT
jgi:hypothetical protein